MAQCCSYCGARYAHSVACPYWRAEIKKETRWSYLVKLMDFAKVHAVDTGETASAAMLRCHDAVAIVG